MGRAHHILGLNSLRLVLGHLILIQKSEIVHYHQMKIKIKFRRPAISKLEIKILPLRMKYQKNLGLINHGIVRHVMLSSTNDTTSISMSRMCTVIESESI